MARQSFFLFVFFFNWVATFRIKITVINQSSMEIKKKVMFTTTLQLDLQLPRLSPTVNINVLTH